MLLNFDFKQIEVVILAVLAKDKKLLEIVESGDIYKYFATKMYNKTEELVSSDERNSMKEPVLGMSYGRGAKALAESSGKSIEWCNEFIEKFYLEFPNVQLLHKNWEDEVNRTGKLEVFDGISLRFKRYIWNKQKQAKEESSAWNAKYWIPQIKNYPVQHTAFVILSTFTATFFREYAIHNRDKYLMISTVHDSLVFDVRNDYIEVLKEDLNKVLDKLPNLCYKLYGLEIPIKVRAEVSTGNNLLEV